MPRKPKFIGRDARGRPIYRFRQKKYINFPNMCRSCKREPAMNTGFCYWCAERMGLR